LLTGLSVAAQPEGGTLVEEEGRGRKTIVPHGLKNKKKSEEGGMLLP